MIAVDVFSHLSLKQARQHLEKALNIYFNFRQAANQQDLVLLHQLLFPEDKAKDPEKKVKDEEDPEGHVELLVTHTYYFLAQVEHIPHKSSSIPKY